MATILSCTTSAAHPTGERQDSERGSDENEAMHHKFQGDRDRYEEKQPVQHCTLYSTCCRKEHQRHTLIVVGPVHMMCLDISSHGAADRWEEGRLPEFGEETEALELVLYRVL